MDPPRLTLYGSYLPRALFLVVAAPSALLAAQRLRSASDNLRRPSGVMPPLRFALVEAAADAEPPAFFAAHLALRASESRRRPSGVMPPFRFPLPPRDSALPPVETLDDAVPAAGPSISRRAASARSIPARCCSSFLITSSRPLVIFSPVFRVRTHQNR